MYPEQPPEQTTIRVGGGPTRGDLRKIDRLLAFGSAVVVIGRRRDVLRVRDKLAGTLDLHCALDQSGDEPRLLLWRGPDWPTFAYFTNEAQRRRG
jgi:hypothetical protein